MKPDVDLSPRFLGMTPAVAAVAVIAVSTMFRFFYAVWLPILPDEAYYFQWSQHLDASYFSKGPAVAYTIAAGTALFGDNNLGVRFFAVMLSAGTAWQVFLLARRWYDETTALLAVLVTGVVPIYAVGAVLMTIDPLSAFFWVWAANLFSRAIARERMVDWALTGFAVGCGFLAKYLNALELAAFLIFLLLARGRRALLARAGFWVMLAVAVACTTPVLWWNEAHHWVSAGQLATRGKLNGPFDLHVATFGDFVTMQAVVVSPLLFVALMMTAVSAKARNEGELLMLVLFLSVFGFYAVLGMHLKGEPNWPAVSYLTLIIMLAARWREMAVAGRGSGFAAAAFLVAWAQTVVLHDPEFLHLPQKMDPMGRVVGWSEIAGRLEELRREQHADVLIADAYKEASVFSFELPDHAFIYTLRHEPPSNQFDLWPGYPRSGAHEALWITGEKSGAALEKDFASVVPVERVVVSFAGKPFREYTVYRCEMR